MRTGLHKCDKTTEIYFDKRIDEDVEKGCKSFVIAKRRFSVRVTAPYSEERRRAAGEAAKRQ